MVPTAIRNCTMTIKAEKKTINLFIVESCYLLLTLIKTFSKNIIMLLFLGENISINTISRGKKLSLFMNKCN